jgi:hypothetical protein
MSSEYLTENLQRAEVRCLASRKVRKFSPARNTRQ